MQILEVLSGIMEQLRSVIPDLHQNFRNDINEIDNFFNMSAIRVNIVLITFVIFFECKMNVNCITLGQFKICTGITKKHSNTRKFLLVYNSTLTIDTLQLNDLFNGNLEDHSLEKLDFHWKIHNEQRKIFQYFCNYQVCPWLEKKFSNKKKIIINLFGNYFHKIFRTDGRPLLNFIPV